MSTAMLPWQLFATSLSEGSGSLINNANLISKVYFPRLIVPASAVIVSFVDFAISMVLLGIIMAIHQIWPGRFQMAGARFRSRALSCRWLRLDFSSPLESGISGKRNVLLRT